MASQASSSSSVDYASISILAQAAETRRKKFRKLGFIFGWVAAASLPLLILYFTAGPMIAGAVPAVVNMLGIFVLLLLFGAFPSMIVGFVFMAMAISARTERDRLVAAASQPSA
ncbi:MAG: hypothetical protein RLZZ626_726 [Actinomycetota bacterium]|jgi:hypothetical protein